MLKSFIVYISHLRYLRGFIFSCLYKNISWPFSLNKGLKYKNIKWLKTGKGVGIDDHAEFYIKKLRNGSIPEIKLGAGVWIGRYNIISCVNRVTLEENVLLAPFVFIIDHSHNYDNPYKPIKSQGISSKGPILIKQNTWIGAFTQVLGGVTIGRNCIIAAGSVVNNDIPDYCMAAGRPAKVIKRYNLKTTMWEKINNSLNESH